MYLIALFYYLIVLFYVFNCVILCILILLFYVFNCVVLCIVLIVLFYVLFVCKNVYCTTATGCQPNCI